MVRTLVLYLCLALLALLCIADASDIKLQPAGGPQRRFLLKNATPDEHNKCVNDIETKMEEYAEKHYKGGADDMLIKFDANGDGIAQTAEIKAAMVEAGVPANCQLGESIVLEGGHSDL